MTDTPTGGADVAPRDDYLRPLPEWQQDVFGQLREIIHEADPESETIKRTVQPTSCCRAPCARSSQPRTT